jgi:hypothetical protein
LKTPIIGRSAAAVDSSSSDILAGLSKWEILKDAALLLGKYNVSQHQRKRQLPRGG